MNTPTDSDVKWLALVVGLGGVLGLVLIAEVVLVVGWPTSWLDTFSIGAVSSAIAIAGILYGGYWAANSEVSRERYRRLAGWCFLGAGSFFALNVLIILSTSTLGIFHVVGWLRWAISLGGAVGVLVGIFEARAIERAQHAERLRVEKDETDRRNELLDEFASIVSHDLRNPLNVAIGRLGLAREEVDSEHFDDVERALDRMETIVEDTLVMAREGKAVRETESIELMSIVNDSWASVDTRNAELIIGDLGTIAADAARLRHVFENLFRNAVEHGGDDVTVRVGSLADGFYVEDDGPGISAEDVDRIFGPGYTTTGQGSGFGMGIVRRIIEAHRWELTVTASNEGGARFEITGVESTEMPPKRSRPELDS